MAWRESGLTRHLRHIHVGQARIGQLKPDDLGKLSRGPLRKLAGNDALHKKVRGLWVVGCGKLSTACDECAITHHRSPTPFL